MAGLTVSPYGSVRGVGPDGTRSAPVAPNSTFVVNDLLMFDSSGRLTQTVISGSNLTSTAATIAGIASGNAQGFSPGGTDVNPYMVYTVAQPGFQWVIPIYSATASNAVWNSSLAGKSFALRYIGGAGTGYWAVNIDVTTTPSVIITDPVAFPSEGSQGWPIIAGAYATQYPLVYVEFLAAACALTGA